MSCSWSTVLNPSNMPRLLWNFTVDCWRRLHSFCVRITNRRAPTVDRIVAFQAQSTQPRWGRFRRQLSLQGHDGSLSSNQDGTLSDRSPSFEFNILEIASQTLPNPGASSEKNVSDPEPSPRNDQGGGQVQQETPLLRREASQMSHDKPSASSASDSKPVADSTDRSYRTF